MRWNREPGSETADVAQGRELTGAQTVLGVLYLDFLTPLIRAHNIKNRSFQKKLFFFKGDSLELGLCGQVPGLAKMLERAQRASHCAGDMDVNGPLSRGTLGSCGCGSQSNIRIPDSSPSILSISSPSTAQTSFCSSQQACLPHAVSYTRNALSVSLGFLSACDNPTLPLPLCSSLSSHRKPCVIKQ